jgi:TonB family protein
MASAAVALSLAGSAVAADAVNSSGAAKEERYIIETRLFRGASPKSPLKAEPAILITAFSDLFVAAQGAREAEASGGNSLAALKAELAEIYNLVAVDQVSAGRLIWDGRRDRVSQAVLLGETMYPMLFFPKITGAQTATIRVEVNREAGEAKPEAILATDVRLRLGERMVLGFPLEGESLHLSLLVRKLSRDEILNIPVEVKDVPGPGIVAVQNILPSPISAPLPEYPERIKKRKIEGVVILRVATDQQGKVRFVAATGATHPDLAMAAERAVWQWRYRPVLWKGRPVSSGFYIRFEFRLLEGERG